MKPSGIGGQAVLEGVMMKNGTRYAVAVRKPDGQIEVDKQEFHSKAEKYPVLGTPFVRGVVNFAESMVLGMRTLTWSSAFYEEAEQEPSAFEKKLAKIFGEKLESVMMGLTVAFSVILAVAIFMLLPFLAASLLSKVIESDILRTLIEGVLRILIFIGYVLIISRMEDIRRVFMYHGAEHKSINCIENGLPLTVENVKQQTTRHKRCGTSFMLFVIIISAIFFMFIRVDNMLLRMLFRILLIPVIAGVSYEFIKLAGRSENRLVGLLSKPGLWLQGLTTKEPDEDMIEVAIRSVEAVFDWQAFLAGKEPGSCEVTGCVPKAETATGETAATTVPTPKKTVKVITVNTVDGPVVTTDEEEDDDILRALDRFFTSKREEGKSAEAAEDTTESTEPPAEEEQP